MISTNIEELYARYPDAKEDADDYLKYWEEEFDEDNESYFHRWVNAKEELDELRNFLDDCIDWDRQRYVAKEISDTVFKRRKDVITKILTPLYEYKHEFFVAEFCDGELEISESRY